MPTYLIISKHSPTECPMHNSKMRKLAEDVSKRSEELNKKFGCKDVGSWNDFLGHTLYVVIEAPSAEALQKTMMDPIMVEWLAHNETEIKMIMTEEEAAKFAKFAK
jgi:hypothetical protein